MQTTSLATLLLLLLSVGVWAHSAHDEEGYDLEDFDEDVRDCVLLSSFGEIIASVYCLWRAPQHFTLLPHFLDFIFSPLVYNYSALPRPTKIKTK